MLAFKIYCLEIRLKTCTTESWLFILMSFQPNRLNQFVPGYQPKSDFIPGSRVTEVSEVDRVQIVRLHSNLAERYRSGQAERKGPQHSSTRLQSFSLSIVPGLRECEHQHQNPRFANGASSSPAQIL